MSSPTSQQQQPQQQPQETQHKGITFNIFLIGSEGVGKKSFLSRLKSITTKANPTHIELLSKGDTIIYTPSFPFSYTTCICDQCQPLRFNDEITSEDEDFEVEKSTHMNFRATHKSIIDHFKAHSSPLNSSSESVFIFMYDKTDYTTFEELVNYYESLSRKFHFNNNVNNVLTILISNKQDKQTTFTSTEQNDVTTFIAQYPHIKTYDISTKMSFNFKRFVSQLFEYCLNKKDFAIQHEVLLDIFNFKQSFNKAPRKGLNFDTDNPGVGAYNVNQYNYNSNQELYDSLVNKKTRFTTKIFANKSGPVITSESNQRRVCINDAYNSTQRKNVILPPKSKRNTLLAGVGQMMLGSITPGYSFPSKPGMFALKSKRAELRDKRNNELQSSFDDNSISNLSRNSSPKSRTINNDDYYQQAIERKNSYNENQSAERQEQRNKYALMQQENISNIQRGYINKSNTIVGKYNKDNELTEEEKKEKARQHYYDIIYSKNTIHLQHDDTKSKRLLNEKNKQIRSAKNVGPQSYDTRGDMLNPNKGVTIVPKRNVREAEVFTAPYQCIPTEFDVLVNKQKDYSISYSPRTDNKDIRDYMNEAEDERVNQLMNSIDTKHEKHLENKKKNEKYLHVQMFLDRVKANEQRHNEIMKEHQKEEDKYYKHLYKSQPVKEICYTQVETQSPAYSMQGRYNKDNQHEDKFVLRRSLGGRYAVTEGNEGEKELASPNFNYVKPKPQMCAFGKAERFTSDDNGNDNDKASNYNAGYDNNNTLQDSVSFSNKEPL